MKKIPEVMLLKRLNFLLILFVMGVAIGCYFVFATSLSIDPILSREACGTVRQKGDDSVQTSLQVLVLDIDQAKKTATLEISLTLWNFPNVSTSVVDIGGDGDIRIICRINEQYKILEGSNRTTWYLRGRGELYPFDSYTINFTIFEISPPANFTFNQNLSFAQFWGPNIYSLRDTWQTTDESNELPVEYGSRGFVVKLERRSWTPSLQLLLPIIACYYFLGGSLLIERSDLNARLRVYLSLFVFAPMFFIAIQHFLPYRSSLSFPELLLANLVVSNAILGIFSMIPSRSFVTGRRLDIFAICISLLTFALLGMIALPFVLVEPVGWRTICIVVALSYIYVAFPILMKHQKELQIEWPKRRTKENS